jgi:hypothetical protein
VNLFRGSYAEPPVVWLDTGAFFGDGSEAGRFQSETLIEGMNRLGYAAANVTDRELAGGVEGFLELARKASFPLISANLVFQGSGKTILMPFAVHTLPAEVWRGSRPLRIGILGLAAERPAFLQTMQDGRKVVIAPPIPAASKMVPLLRQQADMVVVLANLDAFTANRMVQQVPGIDLVLAGDGDRVSDNEAMPPSPRVLYAGNQGKRIGEARLFFSGQVLANLATTHLFLDRRYPDDAEMKELEVGGNARINEHYRKLAEENPVQVATGVALSERYAGAEACRECHEEPFLIWDESGHRRAILTLVEAGQEYNPLCVSCHVTGHGEPDGFHNLTASPERADVQCEACHGPGAAHVESPAAGYGDTGAERCASCHTPENSPDYQFQAYWERIRH